MKIIKLLFLFSVFLPLTAAAQGFDFTTTTTAVFCVNDGSITVTVANATGHVQYELVNYSGSRKRSVIGVPQDDPVFLNLAPGTYTVGVYDDNNTTTPVTKEVIVPDYGSGRTLTINSIYSSRLAYCAGDTNPGSLLRIVPNGGKAPYIITVLDTNDVAVREETSYGSYDFLGMPAGTYKIRVKDNCGTVVNSNSPHVIAPNIVYDFTLSTPTYWYWSNNVKVTHSGAGTICDPVTDAYYDFSYSGGIPVIKGNDDFPISQAPGITRMYAVEYDGVKTPYMTYSELQAYKQPLPLDINTWKPMILWVSICGVEKSTVYPFPSRKNEFLPKLIANAGLTFYLADDAASTLCAPTGFVKLSRLSLLSGFCDPLTLTITEKNGAVPPQQYTITGASQNDFEAQLIIGNTYTLKLTDVNGSELNRFSYVNVTRGQWINMNSRTEVFLDPASFRYYNQDELPFELASMADFKNFGKSQLGIKADYFMPMPYNVSVTGPNGFYLEKTFTSLNYSGALISDNLETGDYSVHVTSPTGCYDRTFTTTLDRVIDSISVTSAITPDPIACDRYVKTFNYKISNKGLLRPYPSTSFESMFNVPQIGFKVIEGPSGYTQKNAVINGTYSWLMSFNSTATATFRGDITGLYNISLVDYYEQTKVIDGPWELDVKSEFPVFDMNGSGGAICTGSTTGTLSIAVKNATSPVYYLKKATDSNYPATGQSSPDFTNLTVGDYRVKVETACYPTALEASFKMDYISNIGSVIVGENNLCAGDALNLAIKSLGPISSAEWKLPDGTTQTGNSLVLSNPQSGQYSVIVTTRSGCMVTDAIEVKVKRRSVAADQRPLNPKTCNLGNEMLLSAFKYPNPTLGKIYNWYSAPELGAENLVYSGNSYYGFTPTEIKTYTFYVTVTDDEACENLPGTAAEVTLMVIPEPPVPNGDAVQSFCKETVPLVGDLVTDAVVDIAWYASPTLGDRPIPMNTPLVDGQLYYAGTLYGGEYSFGCEGKTRLEVTAKLNDRATAADITGLSQSICDGQGADMLVSSAVVNPIFTWYSDAALTNVIATGENYGVTPTETTSYYVTVKGDNACENLPGTAKEIIITVNPALVVTPPNPIITDNQSIVPDINFDSSAAGTLYVWSVDDSGIGLEDNWISSPNIPSFEAINTGTEPVTATVTVYPIGTFCGAGPFTFTIIVNPDIVMNQPTDIKVCTQNTVSEITFDSSITGTTYSWINDNPKIGLAANGTGNIVAFTAINNGDSTEIATITVTPAANGRTGKPVVFTIEVNPQGAMNKIENQNICLGETALLSVSSSTVNNPIFTWYSDVALTDVLAIDSNYSVSPLVTTIYYVTVKGDNACEGNTGMPVTVDVNEVLAPTGNARQEFCLEQNALVSDLVTNENNVIWYDAANGGNIIPNGTALINGSIYYGSLNVGTCESITRLAVTAIINNAGTPTGNARQEFCLSENALISDLVTNENNVIWYDAANGGNIIPNETALINGSIYYGSLKVGTCESTSRLAVTAIINNAETPTGNTRQEFCLSENALVSNLVTNENNVIWYDAATGGNIIPNGTALINDSIYYGSLKIGTCESTTRLAVTAIINNAGTPTGNTRQEFCLDQNALVSDLVTNENNVIWYDAANGGNIIPNETALINGSIYYGSLKVGTCESTSRLAVTAIINNAGTPTGNTRQEFCLSENALVSNLVTNENNVIWYDAANGGNIIPNGIALINGSIYYGSLKVGTCESISRLAVTAIINNAGIPTGNARQEFCLSENALVSDLVTNENNVIWYDAANGGNIISNGTALINGSIYYGSLKVGTCESTTRLAVTAIINNAETPTGNTRQEFCLSENALVSDLVTNENNVIWYDAANGGNIIPNGIALINGSIYYGSLKVGTCESTTRLAVTAIINNAETPTGNTRQEFCLSENALVSDLVTNENNVIWYDAANGGNIISNETALINGSIYYGSLKVGTCESISRLAVTAIINNAGIPTGNARQEFCLSENALVSDLVTNENNVIWYDAANGGNIISNGTALINGSIYYGSLKVGTCENLVRLAVTAIIKADLPGETIGWNTTACVGDEVTYRTTALMSNYNWRVNGGTIKSGGQFNDDFVTVSWTTGGNGSIGAAFINASNCDPIVTIHFPVTITVCSDIAIGKRVNNPTPTIGEQVIFTVTATNIGTNDFQHVNIDEMLPSGYSYVLATTTSGTYNSTSGVWSLPVLTSGKQESLTLTAKVLEKGDYRNIAILSSSTPEDPNPDNNSAEATVVPTGIIIYNAVSANGDGLNDYFKIEGLHHYPDNTVEIYNRWGVKIFETNGYGSNDNVFRGISDGRTTVKKGEIVPEGTYFYMLRYKTNTGAGIEKSGYLYVN